MLISDKLKSALLIITFLISEYFLQRQIESLGAYAIYICELILLALFFLVFKKNHELYLENPRKSGIILLASLLFLGFFARTLAGAFGILIPFDFSSTETLVFLLAVGPILEELLFRGLLHKSFHTLLENTKITSAITSLMFSYSHFQAYFNVPTDFHPFIFYQTGYTLALGLFCSQVRINYGVTWAIFAHALFNFGFFVAGLF
jgi:membrane protease YdiL (CAAX protease family)